MKQPELIASPGAEEIEKLSYLIAQEFVSAFQEMGWPEIQEENQVEPKPLVRRAGA